jgi:hypothetical protein
MLIAAHFPTFPPDFVFVDIPTGVNKLQDRGANVSSWGG